MDVVEALDKAGGVVDVLQQRFAVFALFDIDQVHGRAGGAVVDAGALDLQIMARVLAVQGEIAGGIADRGRHQIAREPQPTVGAVDRAGARQSRRTARNRVGEADGLQNGEHGFVDLFEIILAQRLVPAAGQPGAHRADLVGQRRGPDRTPCLPAAAAPRAGIRRRIRMFHQIRHRILSLPHGCPLCRRRKLSAFRWMQLWRPLGPATLCQGFAGG